MFNESFSTRNICKIASLCKIMSQVQVVIKVEFFILLSIHKKQRFIACTLTLMNKGQASNIHNLSFQEPIFRSGYFCVAYLLLSKHFMSCLTSKKLVIYENSVPWSVYCSPLQVFYTPGNTVFLLPCGHCENQQIQLLCPLNPRK